MRLPMVGDDPRKTVKHTSATTSLMLGRSSLGGTRVGPDRVSSAARSKMPVLLRAARR
jgi:hypothetical protein